MENQKPQEKAKPKSPSKLVDRNGILVDRNGNPIALGDVIKVRPIEKPDVVAIGPVVALDWQKVDEPKGLVAWTRDGGAIEKAHFVPASAEILHKPVPDGN